jgi:hypothetical protein
MKTTLETGGEDVNQGSKMYIKNQPLINNNKELLDGMKHTRNEWRR